jgi:AraC-like DNA-binding protein
MFADGHASIVFDLGLACHLDGVWRPDAFGGRIIGPMTRVDSAQDGKRPAMVGAYLHAGHILSIARVMPCELTDKVVTTENVWNGTGSELAVELSELNEPQRIDRLEGLMIRRIRQSRISNSQVDIPKLADSVHQCAGRVTIEDLANSAGVSRQHLTRLFRESVGISPKLYCRLARFQSGLTYAGHGKTVDWAQAALAMGYSDQSHMIAEFREFSSLTPQRLAAERWFHPFIERARVSGVIPV